MVRLEKVLEIFTMNSGTPHEKDVDWITAHSSAANEITGMQKERCLNKATKSLTSVGLTILSFSVNLLSSSTSEFH